MTEKLISIAKTIAAIPTIPDSNTDRPSEFISIIEGSVGIKSEQKTPAGFFSSLVPYLIVIAGLILLVMLISGGFQMLTAGTSPDQAEAGKKRITTAIIGFILVFAAYWLAELIGLIFGIKVV